MITLIQRVSQAKVIIEKRVYSQIKNGYVILLGIVKDDQESDIDKLVDKIINLRVMADENNKMNKSILETNGEILLVSQFTLAANLRGGRRPDFFPAMQPEKAEKFYNLFIEKLKVKNLNVKSGQFAAYMEVEFINDGPVTFILDSKNL